MAEDVRDRHQAPLRQTHEATLANIDQLFGEVATADQVMGCWRPARLPAVT